MWSTVESVNDALLHTPANHKQEICLVDIITHASLTWNRNIVSWGPSANRRVSVNIFFSKNKNIYICVCVSTFLMCSMASFVSSQAGLTICSRIFGKASSIFLLSSTICALRRAVASSILLAKLRPRISNAFKLQWPHARLRQPTRATQPRTPCMTSYTRTRNTPIPRMEMSVASPSPPSPLLLTYTLLIPLTYGCRNTF